MATSSKARVARKTQERYVAQIDEAELVLRMIEAGMGQTRPDGMSAPAVLAAMDPEVRDIFTAASRSAMEYWRECINEMNRTN